MCQGTGFVGDGGNGVFQVIFTFLTAVLLDRSLDD